PEWTLVCRWHLNGRSKRCSCHTQHPDALGPTSEVMVAATCWAKRVRMLGVAGASLRSSVEKRCSCHTQHPDALGPTSRCNHDLTCWAKRVRMLGVAGASL